MSLIAEICLIRGFNTSCIKKKLRKTVARIPGNHQRRLQSYKGAVEETKFIYSTYA